MPLTEDSQGHTQKLCIGFYLTGDGEFHEELPIQAYRGLSLPGWMRLLSLNYQQAFFFLKNYYLKVTDIQTSTQFTI